MPLNAARRPVIDRVADLISGLGSVVAVELPGSGRNEARLEKACHERQRCLRHLPPTFVDRQRVTASVQLDKLGDGVANAVLLLIGAGYRAGHGVIALPGDHQQRSALRSRRVDATRCPGGGAIEANSGETLAQLALDGVGIARIGNFSLGDAVAEGRLIPLLEIFNPGDKEVFHAVFIGGANMPARVRVFVDYLVERMSDRLKAANEVATMA